MHHISQRNIGLSFHPIKKLFLRSQLKILLLKLRINLSVKYPLFFDNIPIYPYKIEQKTYEYQHAAAFVNSPTRLTEGNDDIKSKKLHHSPLLEKGVFFSKYFNHEKQ